MKFSNSYIDLSDQEGELTEHELEWFNGTVKRFDDIQLKLFGFIIPITNRDHWTDYRGTKSKESYGVYSSRSKEEPIEAFITIDNEFIHECYDQIFNGAWNLTFETLEGAISHEIAHGKVFRHGKKHRELTKQILEQYQGNQ